MRQHVNPLSLFHQLPRPLPPITELFPAAAQPLHLDVGCARGRFLMAMAECFPLRNHLGVEIRRPLVDAAEQERLATGLTNLRFAYRNANVSLPAWLEGLPNGVLELVTIQFPDPWFKKKHNKRRVLQPDLLRGIAAALAPGRRLFLQSDVRGVIDPMVDLVEHYGWFERPPGQNSPWLEENPLAVASEREALVLRQGLPVHRALYERNRQPLPAADSP